MITLTIDEAVPSANKLRKHWSVLKKNRDRWNWLVIAARLNAKAQPQSLSRAVVRIERYGKRILDQDNFVHGAKSLMDSLVTQHFIVDDAPEHVTVTYLQYKGTPERTVVTIVEAA